MKADKRQQQRLAETWEDYQAAVIVYQRVKTLEVRRELLRARTEMMQAFSEADVRS